MIVNIRVKRSATKAIIAAVAVSLYAVLIYIVLSNFVITALTDSGVSADAETLAAAVKFFPNSATLRARLAEAEMDETSPDLEGAEFSATEAVKLSPNNYGYWLLLGTIKEWKDGPAAAEPAISRALELAPNRVETRWQLANLLVRAGKLNESLEHFKIVGMENSSLLPATFDLLWQAANHRIDLLKSVATDKADSSLMLAQFLLDQGQTVEALSQARTLNGLSPSDSVAASTFLNGLIARSYFVEARELWAIFTGGEASVANSPITNGSFESDISTELNQFDWALRQTDYARITIVSGTSRTGERSLRIDFAGRDTTRLEGEIKQLAVLRSGARYRLECYVRSKGLVTPEGPRIVVMAPETSNWLAASEPVQPGTDDWKPLSFEFTAPVGGSASRLLAISVCRKPAFSYDEPTKGAIWFDDFSITEIKGVGR